MAEPIAGYVLRHQFCTLDVGACPVFVAVTEREIGVRTRRRTVLINATFWPRVQHVHPRPYCTTITSGSVRFCSVPFRVLYLPLVSNTPRISWRVNWVSDRRRCMVAFFGMRYRDGRPAFAERVPIYVHTYFIRCPAAEYAIQKPDENWTRLSPPEWESGLQD